MSPNLIATLRCEIDDVYEQGNKCNETTMGTIAYLRALATQQTIRMARIMRAAPADTEATITVSFCCWDSLLGSVEET